MDWGAVGGLLGGFAVAISTGAWAAVKKHRRHCDPGKVLRLEARCRALEAAMRQCQRDKRHLEARIDELINWLRPPGAHNT